MGKALTVTELADYLGLAKDTIYRKARADEIPGVRIGRNWRFLQDVIDEWLRGEAGSGGKGAKDKKAKKLPISELRRRGRLVRRIVETRKTFEKLPITADEAYRISRRDLERRSLKWN